MQQFAALAEQGCEALLAHDVERLAALIDENYDTRAAASTNCPPGNKKWSQRRCRGASAKFAGLAGPSSAQFQTTSSLECLREELARIECRAYPAADRRDARVIACPRWRGQFARHTQPQRRSHERRKIRLAHALIPGGRQQRRRLPRPASRQFAGHSAAFRHGMDRRPHHALGRVVAKDTPYQECETSIAFSPPPTQS